MPPSRGRVGERFSLIPTIDPRVDYWHGLVSIAAPIATILGPTGDEADTVVDLRVDVRAGLFLVAPTAHRCHNIPAVEPLGLAGGSGERAAASAPGSRN